MQDSLEQVRVAVIQATPILFDRQATVEKTCQLAADAAAQGAQLLVFPEAFIPAYPRGLGFGTVVGSRSPSGRCTWERYWANGVDVPRFVLCGACPAPPQRHWGRLPARPKRILPLVSLSGTRSSAGARSTAPRSISAPTAVCWGNTASSSQPVPND